MLEADEANGRVRPDLQITCPSCLACGFGSAAVLMSAVVLFPVRALVIHRVSDYLSFTGSQTMSMPTLTVSSPPSGHLSMPLSNTQPGAHEGLCSFETGINKWPEGDERAAKGALPGVQFGQHMYSLQAGARARLHQRV
jgi:hypothetical protein